MPKFLRELFRSPKQHRGTFRQIPIYLGKFFRMFIYMDDWKVLPMSAIVAALVAFVVGKNLGVSMEATLKSSLALTCVCIWNGFFNSIQVVCRERDIVKREHRNGMHIFSYIVSHMIYQAFICLLQTIITIAVCVMAKIQFPAEGFITSYFYLDLGITLFLITYAADMMSLTISCLAKTTTAAMTLMPFLLIFELVFSGTMFGVGKDMEFLTNASIAKWGTQCICAQMDYNELKMTSVWSQVKKMKNVEYEGSKPVAEVIEIMEEDPESIEEFELNCAKNNQKDEYAKSEKNIYNCWSTMGMFIIVFALLSMLVLGRIDKDSR